MQVVFANPAFCRLLAVPSDSLLGKPIAKFLPEKDECLTLLHRVYQSGVGETHTESSEAKPHPLYWSYEVWPIWEDDQDKSLPSGVSLLVTETAPLRRRTALLNQALILSAVRHHELMEEAVSLNKKLAAEIEERQRVEREIEQMAYYDALTDLPNRRLLMDRLHQATISCSRTLDHGAILFIDLDRFKELNDTQGHEFGDILLQQTAQRLKHTVREEDTVARLGGDEFVLLLERLSRDRVEATVQAKAVASKILTALNEPYMLSGRRHRSSGSIGVTVFGKDRESVSELLTRADLAQYKAKSAGGSAFRFFDPEMQAREISRAVLESDLRKAVPRGQLRLYYQPQIDYEGQLVGYEALLRWIHPDRGLLLPADFIVAAEEHGIIESIGMWVVETACKQLVSWAGHPKTSSLTLSVNISAREFAHADFVHRMLTIIDENGVDPTRLLLELTERLMFGPTADILPKMLALRARGLQFALDDFGVGFSSLSSLRTLPVSQLKLDRSFVSDILTSDIDGAIVDAIIVLGKTLRMTVVAEGVESEEQKEILRTRGCDLFQGFLFGAPVPLETV